VTMKQVGVRNPVPAHPAPGYPGYTTTSAYLTGAQKGTAP
jgi:hypothetical protein